MAYNFKVPNPMRVFEPIGPRTKLMYPIGECVDVDDIIKISGVVIMCFDHRDKLVLKVDQKDHYLLVDEIDEASQLAHQWTHLHEESGYGKDAAANDETESEMKKLLEDLAPILRKYIRPEFQVVTKDAPLVVMDKQGPGIDLLLTGMFRRPRSADASGIVGPNT